jgi:hypothetical protein
MLLPFEFNFKTNGQNRQRDKQTKQQADKRASEQRGYRAQVQIGAKTNIQRVNYMGQIERRSI